MIHMINHTNTNSFLSITFYKGNKKYRKNRKLSKKGTPLISDSKNHGFLDTFGHTLGKKAHERWKCILSIITVPLHARHPYWRIYGTWINISNKQYKCNTNS